MKSKKNEEEEENSMLYISFNQDNSFFSVGAEKGFAIYRTEPFTKEPYFRNMNGGIGIVEMIENSNFLALMGGGKIPRYDKKKVVIYDDNLNKEICELKFATEIRLVKYKKNNLFIVCQKRIFIFDLDTYENICEINTGDNKKELIAVNKNQEPSLIAYPAEGSENKNKISIKDYLNKDKEIKTFKLQDDAVSKISLNNDGRLIASANEFGKIIKIHSTEDGTFLMEFNRGREKAKINTICFDVDTKFMAVSSSRGTIHIFSMGSTIHELNQHRENINKADSNKKIIKKENKKDNILINKDSSDENRIKDENKKEGNENKEENEIKIEEIKEGNKTEEIKEENKIEEVKNENNNNEGIKKEKEDEIINKKENNEINNIESEKEINKNMPNGTPETNDEERLPENTKSFFGGLFGSRTEKSFAKVRLEKQESICAFINKDELAIVTANYKFYKYLIQSGDCKKEVEEDIKLK